MNTLGSYRPRRAQTAPVGRIALALAVVASTLISVSVASAYWTSAGSADAFARTGTLAAPVDVVVPADDAVPVRINWTPGDGGVEPEGYYVTRVADGTEAAACDSSPTSLVLDTTCLDDPRTDETVTYVVTAVRATWTARSEPSRDVLVPGQLTVATTSLADGIVGAAYSLVLSGKGGTPPYAWAVSGLPDGLDLDPGTGRLTGTPETAGEATVSVTLTDVRDGTATAVLTLTSVPKLLVTTARLPEAVGEEDYAFTLGASGGTAPYSWSASGLPSGMSLSAAGVLSGSPSGAAGAASVAATVTDARGQTTTREFTLTVERPTGIAAGGSHTCALLASGSVKCWGSNSWGQLGNGTYDSSRYPVQVSGLTSGVTAISAGTESTCALVRGAAKCWGRNDLNQLGDGSSEPWRTTPTQVSGLTEGVTGISVGSNHACALTSGLAKCWGSNYQGQLGDGTFTQRSKPVPVTGLPGEVDAIDVGSTHTCAVVAGAAYCWGYSYHGQLGNGTKDTSSRPVPVTGLSAGVTAISAGAYHSCAVVSGSVSCWGSNSSGMLGDGTRVLSTTPVVVGGLTGGATAVSVGTSHSCAVVGGSVSCWGQNSYGQLGDGTTVADSVTAVPVSGLVGVVTAISAGSDHTCVQLSGSARCWGSNSAGQLGDGTAANRNTPVRVIGLVLGVGTARITVNRAEPFSTTLEGTGGSAPYTLAATDLPTWLSFNPGTRVLSGTPTTAGTFIVSLTVVDSVGGTYSGKVTLTVSPALSITTTPTGLPGGVVGEPYTATLTGVVDAAPATWEASGLPAGLSLDPTTGVISGTPTVAATTWFPVTVRDVLGNARTKDVRLVVKPSVSITTASLPDGFVGEAWATTLTASGGTAPYRWTATGSLPAGLSLGTDGALQGTPTADGTTEVTVTVTDAHDRTSTKVLTLTVALRLSITTVSIPSIVVDDPYSFTLTGSGGTTPYSWSATGLPSGLSLNPGTGVLSGTATAAGTTEASITLTDASGKTTSRSLSITAERPKAVAAGNGFSCALLDGGSVKPGSTDRVRVVGVA